MKRTTCAVAAEAAALTLLVSAGAAANGADGRFELKDVFQLEYAADPRISPDGSQIVYARTSMDVMKDRRRSSLWVVSSDGTRHRPLVAGPESAGSPRWSPDGTRLAYVSREDGAGQIHVLYLDTGQTSAVTRVTEAPRGIAWSPDGRWIAFSMTVLEPTKPFVEMPPKPEGAEWAPPPKVIEKMNYRADGEGYLEDGYSHLFVVPSDGGTPRQVTRGPFDDGPPQWTPEGRALIFSANRHDDAELDPLNSEVYEVSLASGTVTALTDRKGPDSSPAVSPDGRRIAYLGFDDREQGYQVARLYVMARDGSGRRELLASLDRDVEDPVWSADGASLLFQYDDRGRTRIARVGLDGKSEVLAADVGGLSLGRPYSGGSFSVARDGRIAYTLSRPDRPADVAVTRPGATDGTRLTALNDDLFAAKKLGAIEEITFASSFDGRQVQGWIVKPPAFDPSRKYPMVLEIHGGPFANYGGRFSAEIQLYAAAGYVVLYANPRGSTSYGEEFGNLIHHNYPGEDYDDLMSGVDAVVARGYVDPQELFVTGGSGGGVLTAWIVGKTGRFRAAVVAKPVINWTSFVLTSDGPGFFYKYWFTGFPWDQPEEYRRRSPLSLAGHVTTPTMLLAGEADYRTPISESEQFYEALKLRKVPAALVRIPGASHGIADRPSQLIAKVAHILAWFSRYRGGEAASGS
jgi:dipeptidyl aminopeptidase/acylaminoacyl peptidase